MASPLDDLIDAGQGGAQLDALTHPPLPGEFPAETVTREAAQNRIRARDLADRGIPTYADSRGDVKAVTDDTGKALTGLDSTHNIAYDSKGNPQTISYGADGPPIVKDAFADLPLTTDPKTGDQYKVRDGLPWQYQGQDAAIAAQAQQVADDKVRQKEDALLSRKQTLDEHDLRTVNKQHDQERGALVNDVPTLADPKYAGADLPTVLKGIDEHFNTLYAAPEANETSGFFGKNLTPEAEATRGAIDQQKAAQYERAQNIFALKDQRDQLSQTVDATTQRLRKNVDTQLSHLQGNGPAQETPQAPEATGNEPENAPAPIDDPQVHAQVSAALPAAAKQVLQPPQVNAHGAVEPEGFLATLGREFGSKILPAVATALGGLGAGALAIESGPGAVAADIAGGALAGTAAAKAQRSILGADRADANSAQMEANRQAHPIAAQIGSMLPFLVSLLGGGGAAVKVGGQVAGKAITQAGKEAIEDAVATGAKYAVPTVERIAGHAAAGARAGTSEGAQEKYVEGKDVSVLDSGAKAALQFGATGLFLPAKTMLGMVLGRSVTDAAAMTLAGNLYDAGVHGKPFDLAATAKEIGGDVPAFVLQNAILGFFHAPGAVGGPKGGGGKPGGAAPTEPPSGGGEPPAEPTPPAPPTPNQQLDIIDQRLAQMRNGSVKDPAERDELQRQKDAIVEKSIADQAAARKTRPTATAPAEAGPDTTTIQGAETAFTRAHGDDGLSKLRALRKTIPDVADRLEHIQNLFAEGGDLNVPDQRKTELRQEPAGESVQPPNAGDGNAETPAKGGQENAGNEKPGAKLPASDVATATGDEAKASPVVTIDQAAHEAATSGQNNLPEPTEAQKEAGNYQKGHIVNLGGLNISIENPAGSRRHADYEPLQSHYGYVKGTIGADKDHVDVFVKQGTPVDHDGPVFVINQHNEAGGFDEHKAVIGVASEKEALREYGGNYTKGWKGAGKVVRFADHADFKEWAQSEAPSKGELSPSATEPSSLPQLANTEQAIAHGQSGEANVDSLRAEHQRLLDQAKGEKGDAKVATITQAQLYREAVDEAEKQKGKNATTTGQQQKSEGTKFPRVSPRTDLPENAPEIRKGDSEQAAGRGGSKQRGETPAGTTSKDVGRPVLSKPHEIIRKMIVGVLQKHKDVLERLGHPTEPDIIDFSKDEKGRSKTSQFESGIAVVNYSDGSSKLSIDPARFEKTLSKLTPREKNRYVRRVVEEEIVHIAATKWAKETPGNRDKLSKWGGADDEIGQHLSTAYSDWAKLDNEQKGHEKLRAILQKRWTGKLTESAYQVLKPLLKYLRGAFDKLTPDQQAIVGHVEKLLKGEEKATGKDAVGFYTENGEANKFIASMLGDRTESKALKRGTSYYDKVIRDMGPESRDALKQWLDKNGSAYEKRFLGAGIAAANRSDSGDFSLGTKEPANPPPEKSNKIKAGSTKLDTETANQLKKAFEGLFSALPVKHLEGREKSAVIALKGGDTVEDVARKFAMTPEQVEAAYDHSIGALPPAVGAAATEPYLFGGNTGEMRSDAKVYPVDEDGLVKIKRGGEVIATGKVMRSGRIGAIAFPENSDADSKKQAATAFREYEKEYQRQIISAKAGKPLQATDLAIQGELGGTPEGGQASLFAAATGIVQKALPPEKLGDFIKVSQALVKAGVETPEDLVHEIETHLDEHARPFTQALWDAIGIVRPDLRGTHDWNALYTPVKKESQKTLHRKSRPVADHFFNDPMIDKIMNDHGGILSRTAGARKLGERFAENSSLWDNAPQKLADVSHHAIYNPRSGQLPDKIASAVTDGDVEELWRQIGQISDAAKRTSETEQTQEREATDAEQKAEAEPNLDEPAEDPFGNIEPEEGKTVAEFEIPEGGVKSIVTKRDDGHFAVALLDADAGEVLPFLHIYPPDQKDLAIAKAKEIVGHDERSGADLEPDSGDATPSDAGGEDRVSTGSKPTGHSGRHLDSTPSGGELPEGSSPLSADVPSSASGEESDSPLREPASELSQRPARGKRRPRGSRSSDNGHEADTERTKIAGEGFDGGPPVVGVEGSGDSGSATLDDAAGKALDDALDGLFSSAVKKVDDEFEQKAIPPEKLAGLVTAAQELLRQNINTPQKLAAVLESRYQGKARPYSQGIWDMIATMRPDLRGTHDWRDIYTRLNVPEKATGHAEIDKIAPALTPDQVEDVVFVRARHLEQGKPGVLLANGTGTGKTFSGLGSVAMALHDGAKHILVVAPSDKIGSDWVDTAKSFFKIDDIAQLPSTFENGKGKRVVVTTYANFSQNNSLVDRPWDMIVADECHYLSMNEKGDRTNALETLRALSWHPQGIGKRVEMLEPEVYAGLQSIRQIERQLYRSKKQLTSEQRAKRDTYQEKLKAAEDKVRAKLLGTAGFNWGTEGGVRVGTPATPTPAMKESEKPKVLLMSATPFAYRKNIDYANGYLFDYPPQNTSGAYNTPSPYGQFMIENFGYRMRYGKLTEPENATATGILERQFAERLMREKSMRGRALVVPYDYSREFILTESQLGRKIDEIITHMHSSPRLAVLEGKLGVTDYLQRRFLLEGLKAREAVPRIRKHLALGRKIVAFHDYKLGGAINPLAAHIQPGESKVITLEDGKKETVYLESALAELKNHFPDWNETEAQLSGIESPLTLFKREFGDALGIFNGSVSKGNRKKIVKAFNTSGSATNVFLVQRAAGKEGISLHDTDKLHQRVLIDLGIPSRPTDSIQTEGRIYRIGVKSNAVNEYLVTGTNWERWTFAQTIAQRASTAENLAMGEGARALLLSFSQGFNDAAEREPSADQGSGGKKADEVRERGDPYDNSVALYYTNQKKTSRNKSREGIDYFATPEPIGFKIIEWTALQPGEKFLEPSAGHGAIARFAPDSTTRHAVEPSNELAGRLALNAPDTEVHNIRFEDFNVVNKFDGIGMNSPWGVGGKTAIEHLMKAAHHLKDGGRLVALIPRGKMDERVDKWLSGEETEIRPARPLVETEKGPVYKGDTVYLSRPFAVAPNSPDVEMIVYHVVSGRYLAGKDTKAGSEINIAAIQSITPGPRTHEVAQVSLKVRAEIQLPAVTFERAGTTAVGRVLVLDRTEEEGLSSVRHDLSRHDDAKDLFEALKYLSVPARPENRILEPEPESEEDKPVKKAPEPYAPDPLAERKPLSPENTLPKPTSESDFTPADFTHTQKGTPIFVAKTARYMSREEFVSARERAKQFKGYYSKFKGGGAIPGFHFQTAEDRDGFIGGDKNPLPNRESILPEIPPGAGGGAIRDYYEQDVAPVLASLKATAVEVRDAAVHLLSPTTGVDAPAVDAAFRMLGGRNRAAYIVDRTFAASEKMFQRMPRAEQIGFIDRIKTGTDQPTPELQAIADAMRAIDDANWHAARDGYRALGYENNEIPLAWLENHYRVMWKKIPGNDEERNGPGGRSPLRGTRGMQRQHTLADMSEGIEKGGEPFSYNPVTNFKLAQADIMKLATALKMWAWGKDHGYVEYVRGKFSKPPAGMTWVKDSIANVYFRVPQGVVEPGRYAVETGFGRLLNNFLSEDLVRASRVGRGLLWVKNFTTALELSLSVFHGVFESLEAIGSSIGLGLNKLANRGAFVDAMKDIIKAPLSPINNLTLGNAIRKGAGGVEAYWQTKDGQKLLKLFPRAKEYIGYLFQGGWKPTELQQDWKNNSIRAFTDAVADLKTGNSSNYIGAGLRAFPAANEMLMKPLFEHYIPSLKVAQFFREFDEALKQADNRFPNGYYIDRQGKRWDRPSNATIAREVWRFVENRFGELNYDTLFWNNTFKGAMQLLFRSVTWKLGSVEAFGGAFAGQGKEMVNAFRERRAPELHRNMAWLFGMFLLTAALGTVISHVLGKKSPKTPTDYFFPQIDPTDPAIRVSLPTYFKDMVHLIHSPATYVTSSMSGWISRVADLLSNKDYYGTQIRDTDAPWTKQALQVGKYTGETLLPFSVRGYKNLSAAQVDDMRKALALVGVNPAPRYISQDKAQKISEDFWKGQQTEAGVRPEQFESSQAKRTLVAQIRHGRPANISAALSAGTIKPSDVKAIYQRARMGALASQVNHMPLWEAEKVYAASTPQEKAELAGIMNRKRATTGKKLFTGF